MKRKDGLDELALAAGGYADTELEMAVLGAAMLEQEALPVVLEMLDEACFADEGHRLIFGALRGLFADGAPVNFLTVTDRLRKSGRLEDAGDRMGWPACCRGCFRRRIWSFTAVS